MDIFTLSAKLMLDSTSFDRGVNEAERKGSSLASKLSGGLAKAGSVASKALLAGVTASAGAIAALAKSSVGAFSEYEQLVGGVETLFKDGADKVMKHAQDAYMTAGVDMNTYMQTATSFSAALIQGLEGNYQKAAEITDMAIIDMADNANKMGTDLGSIQNAYNGFAKSNFMMLDNLKLGYGGTRKEMERLLKDAGKLTGKKYDISNLADIYEAIHAIQTEMGITGTTSEEAASTIQGSVGMMRAAWANLKIAFADPKANIGDAIAKMVDTSKTAIKNVLPAFINAIKGIGTAAREIIPILSAELPTIFSELLPSLLEGGIAVVTGIVQGIVDNLPLIAEAAMNMVSEIIRVFKESDSPVLQFLGDGLSIVQQAFQWLIDNQNTVAVAIGAIVAAFSVAQLSAFVANLNPVTIKLAAIAAAATFIVTNWESIKETVITIWENIKTAVDSAWESVSKWFGDVITSVSNAWSGVASWFETNITTPVAGFFDSAFSSISKIWNGVKQSISDAWGAIATWFETTVTTPITGFFNAVFAAAQQIWTGILEAVQNAWSSVSGWVEKNVTNPLKGLFNGVKGVVDSILGALTSIFGMGDKDINVRVHYVNDEGHEAWGEVDESGGGGTETGFAKGARFVPYDMTARIHRGEEILTPSQARHRNEGSTDFSAMIPVLVGAIREGLQDATVRSFISGHDVTDDVSKNTMRQLKARRFAT